MINLSRSLAIFCCMYYVPVGGACGRLLSCGRVLWLPRVTFDVVGHLSVVVCGCGPHDNVSRKLSYLFATGIVCRCVGVSEAVGVSSGCLGLPLML